MADEFSMVDMKLGNTFFGRIDRDTRVVLVGDVKQLPSVGPGNVFRELIESGIIPLTVLDVVFRQDKNSRIVQNADLMQRIRQSSRMGRILSGCRSKQSWKLKTWYEKSMRMRLSKTAWKTFRFLRRAERETV